MDVRAHQGDGQRQAFGIDQQVQLAAGLATPIELTVDGSMVDHVLEEGGPEVVDLPTLEHAFTGDAAPEPQSGRKLSPRQSPAQDVKDVGGHPVRMDGWATPTGSR